MCRILGSVAREPASIRHELLDAENPMIRQSETHDSGWGMAVYKRANGEAPKVVRFPHAANADGDFAKATDQRGRIFNIHVRRATMGGLTLENTHPFTLGVYSFSHNGTVLQFPRLLTPDIAKPKGETDSEVLFNLLMHDLDPADIRAGLRRMVLTVIDRSAFTGLNVLFSDGERLYAYKLGLHELHWLRRPGQLLVASERITNEAWHDVRDDVLLTLDPDYPDEPHAQRLVGDDAVARADIKDSEEGAELRGADRGAFAAERAARLTAGARG
jgi:predicted glutamine amidotransferase